MDGNGNELVNAVIKRAQEDIKACRNLSTQLTGVMEIKYHAYLEVLELIRDGAEHPAQLAHNVLYLEEVECPAD